MIHRIDVPVPDGTLAVYRFGAPSPRAPQVVAIHGITSNSRTWLATARALGDRAALIAVDLRGRAGSAALPPPFGLAAHARDMVSVLDHLELERPVVAGHSLGAFVAARLVTEHADRVSSLVLVDGGLTIPAGQGADPHQFLEALLGPALARLDMTFSDTGAYRAWWGEHPALATGDVDARDLDEYAAHDLTGQPPELRSSVKAQSVRDDGIDLFDADDARSLALPAVLMCAPRGMIDDPNPVQPLALVEEWAAADPERRRAIQVPDTNHYTIALGRAGAERVASEIARAVTTPSAGHSSKGQLAARVGAARTGISGSWRRSP
jgi:pimeloyl-ACP methyl ester carboxylesterase